MKLKALISMRSGLFHLETKSPFHDKCNIRVKLSCLKVFVLYI